MRLAGQLSQGLHLLRRAVNSLTQLEEHPLGSTSSDLRTDTQRGHGRTKTNGGFGTHPGLRSEEHTSELQSRGHLVCRLLLEKKNNKSEFTLILCSLFLYSKS